MGFVTAPKVSAFGTGGPITGVAGKCLENKDGTVTAGNKIQINTCDGSTKQVMRWEGDMSIKVQGYCLDVQNSGTAPGTIVQLWACNGTGAQRWYRQTDGTVKNQNSDLCLDTVGNLSANGTGIQINACSTSPTKLWTISSEAIVKVPLFDGFAHNPLPAGPYNTPTPTITLDYSQLPQWGDYMEQVAKPFMQDWWRAMVDEYAYPNRTPMTSFTFRVEPGYKGYAGANGTTKVIRFNPGYFGYSSHQGQFQDTMIHEISHLMVFNTTRNSDGMTMWDAEGFADTARYQFYGVARPGLSPDRTYASGYHYAEKIFERAQQQSGGTFYEAFLNAAWNGTYNYNLFKQASGSTPAEHWHALTNDTISEATLEFTHALTGKCLNLPNGSTAEGTRIEIYSCGVGSSDTKIWAFKAPQGSSAGTITGMGLDNCLSIDGNGTASGTPVSYRFCGSASNPGQKWEYVGGTLRNPNSGKCLQPVNGGLADGTQLEIQPCNGMPVQQWKLPPITKQAPATITSKILYPGTFSDGQQGLGTTDGKGNGYNRILTAPSGNTYSKPSLTSGGVKVAFLQTANGQQTSTLRIGNSDGSANNQMSTTGYFIPASAPRPLWSSDTLKALVAVTPNGETAVDKQWKWLWVNYDNSGQQLLTSQTIGGTPFAVTSSKVFFINDTGIEIQLCSVNSSDGTGETCFGQASVPKSAALSTDGTKVASAATGTTTSIQLTTVGASTTSTISLPGLGSGLTNVEEVTWVPHTAKIAFRATVSGRTAWYVVDSNDTSKVNKLNVDASSVTWYASAAPKLNYGSFTGLTPLRITDTRPGFGGLNAGKTLTAGATLDVQVAGLGGVPAEGASAVVLNITDVSPTNDGYVTAYPTGAGLPLASTLNHAVNKTVNNQTTVGLGADGKVSIYNNAGSTNILVDVVGYYSENGGSFTPTSPARIVDTRTTGGSLATGSTRTVQVTGVAGVPSSAVSVVADVTEVLATSSEGYLSLYPSDASSAPGTSSMNYYAGQTLTKEVNVKLGANGALKVLNGGQSGSTHFIIDIVGYYTADMAGLTYTAINPNRIADTRPGPGPYANQPIGSGAIKLFTIGSSVMPANAAAVVNNMTLASNSAGDTYLTAFPASVSTQPTATSVTYVNPLAFNQNTVALSSGPSGGFKVYNHNGTTNVILDSLGYFY